MTYTTESHTPGFHHVRIDPLDPSIVRFALTVEFGGFPKSLSDEILSLYASLALTRTQTKDKEAIETYLKRYGIQLKVASSRARINFSGSVRKENVPQLVKLLKEILLTPQIDPKEFERKRKLSLEDNRESRDDAKRIAAISFSNILYDRESIMRETLLDEELAALKRINRQKLETFVISFLANEWYFSVVADEVTAKKFNVLLNILKRSAVATKYIVAEQRLRDSQSSFVTVPGKTNVEIRIGNIVPITADHSDFIPLEFGLAVLGIVGGFSGRLMSTVREKEGLTYGIYARLIARDRMSTAHWNIYTFFTARDLKRGLDAAIREITLIVKKGITESELRTFKEIMLNHRILSHESNATRLSYYHGLSLMGYTAADEITMSERLAKLTVKEVNAALKKYINPDALIIAGAGPVRPDGTGITTP
jgi:zinc protease